MVAVSLHNSGSEIIQPGCKCEVAYYSVDNCVHMPKGHILIFRNGISVAAYQMYECNNYFIC